MTERPELLIGEFAQRCRLPISTLRYYDEIGLLTPAAIDRTSGYRRYRADQLPAAELIARLRALGVAPSQIARILAGGESAATALLLERRRVSQELERGRRQLQELDSLLAVGIPTRYQVDTVELTPRHVAVERFTAPFDQQAAVVLRAIGHLRGNLRRSGHCPTGPWGGAFPLALGDTVEGFVFAPVERSVSLPTLALRGGPAVTAVHREGVDSLPAAYRALFAEIERIDGVPQSPVLEEYTSTKEIRLSIRFTMEP